ncbi:MAG: hypothetical protein HXY24_06765 [Rubrivivax sp.]|nr:hypothetical protein [Rubrivivax sp.]
MTTTTTLRAAALAAACAALVACGETSTADQTVRKSDSPAYQGAANPYVAGGWKPGDEASWEQQMRTRAQGQNEYSRTSGG